MQLRSTLRAHWALALCILVASLLTFSGCSILQAQAEHERPNNLTVWTSTDLTHDPLGSKSTEQHFITSLENRSLFGLTKKGEIQEELARKYEVSADGLTITVTLNDETFSDDSPITSQDVKSTYTRVMQLGGDFAKLLENIKGSGEAKNGSDFFGIAVPDSNSVIFSLIAPDPFFAYHLAHPATGILPSSTIGAAGAFTFGAHSGLYTAESISNIIDSSTIFTPRDEELPVITIVRKSEADIAKSPSTTDADIILAATTDSDRFEQIYIPELAIASWNLYVKDASSPLADIRLRQAILIAMDNKESIAAYSIRASTPKKFTGDTFDSVACAASCETDKEAAKKLVEQIYPTGNAPTLTIDIEDNAIQQDLAASAAKKLEEIGIPTTVKSHDAMELSNVIARGEVQLFRFGWISEVAVGGDPLVRSFKADSTENVSGVTDATLETDIAAYQSATGFQDKLKDSQAIQERIKDLWLTRPVAHFHKIVTVDKSIENLTFDYYGRASVGDIRISS